ncbi:SlyX family protein [Thorsellia kenyensis]|uniref:Protein SlyX n=1 Tax=Thorsellia kenyensis TaxID=1549888 RepID=A0ABV6C9K8_9GAMM
MQQEHDLHENLIILETKVAYQDRTIELLNESIIEQQFELEKLKKQIHYLSKKLHSIEPSNLAMPHEETPPPHY